MDPVDHDGTDMDWRRVWGNVAAALRDHVVAGRDHLLTEDTVRMCTVLALQAEQIDPKRMTLEVPAPQLSGGKLDLVLDGPAATIIELKFPRDSRSGASPDTMTLGELIRDFLRVATVPAQERWVVQVINTRLKRYLTNLATRQRIQWAVAPGEALVWNRADLEALPLTAIRAMGPTAWHLPVMATCLTAEAVNDDLQLFAYRVDGPQTGSLAEALQTSANPAAKGSSSARSPRIRGTGGARTAILDAIQAITKRKGDPVVNVGEVVTEMHRRGTSYADTTIRTMLTSHLCADAQGPGIDTYDDLERVGRGNYRLRHRATQGDRSDPGSV